MTLCTIVFPQIDPVFVHLGPIEIRWYALGYIFGLMLGGLYARALVGNQALWNKVPGTPEDIEKLILWVTIGVIAGGRLAKYVFMNQPISSIILWKFRNSGTAECPFTADLLERL